MSATDYYDEYWDRAAHPAAGWTPSAGRITPEENCLFRRWIPQGSSCLDYGCGDGTRYGRALVVRGVDYRGFDISATALDQARAIGLNVGRLDAAGRTPLGDATMDVAICFEVLEHLQDPQSALAEIRRCLKPGGHALLSVPNAAFWTQRLEFLLSGFWCPGGSPLTARREPWRDPHVRFFHPALLRRLAQAAGFDVVQQLGEGFTLGALPLVWRRPRLRAACDALSRPFAWLGRLRPSLFAARIFLVARRPA